MLWLFGDLSAFEGGAGGRLPLLLRREAPEIFFLCCKTHRYPHLLAGLILTSIMARYARFQQISTV